MAGTNLRFDSFPGFVGALWGSCRRFMVTFGWPWGGFGVAIPWLSTNLHAGRGGVANNAHRKVWRLSTRFEVALMSHGCAFEVIALHFCLLHSPALTLLLSPGLSWFPYYRQCSELFIPLPPCRPAADVARSWKSPRHHPPPIPGNPSALPFLMRNDGWTIALSRRRLYLESCT
jgi:hypothetical protein